MSFQKIFPPKISCYTVKTYIRNLDDLITKYYCVLNSHPYLLHLILYKMSYFVHHFLVHYKYQDKDPTLCEKHNAATLKQ